MHRLLLLLALPGLAQDPKVLLERARDLQTENATRAGQHTFQKVTTFRQFQPDGRVSRQRSETHDVVFVEGEPYEKLVARNGQPLTGKEAAKEEQRRQKTAAERRKQRRFGTIRRTVRLPELALVVEKFDLRLAGEEAVEGRAAWVVEGTPKSGLPEVTKEDKDLVSFSRKFWVAKDSGVPIGRLDTVIREGHFLAPGSTVSFEYSFVNEDAWMLTRMVIDYHARMYEVVKARGETEYRMSGFRKFDVQSTITVDKDPPQD